MSPDPNCKWCHGTGVVGGCGKAADCDHMHTLSFCTCHETESLDAALGFLSDNAEAWCDAASEVSGRFTLIPLSAIDSLRSPTSSKE